MAQIKKMQSRQDNGEIEGLTEQEREEVSLIRPNKIIIMFPVVKGKKLGLLVSEYKKYLHQQKSES